MQFEGQTGQVVYSTTKGALVGMTLPMAHDLEHYSIRIVTIAPGVFVTPMIISMNKKVQESLTCELLFPRCIGELCKFAQMVKWILECPYINGETIRLSGGSRVPAKIVLRQLELMILRNQ